MCVIDNWCFTVGHIIASYGNTRYFWPCSFIVAVTIVAGTTVALFANFVFYRGLTKSSVPVIRRRGWGWGLVCR